MQESPAEPVSLRRERAGQAGQGLLINQVSFQWPFEHGNGARTFDGVWNEIPHPRACKLKMLC